VINLDLIIQVPADREKPSPNHHRRPASVSAIAGVIIHATADEGRESGAESWMCSPAAKVSAHLHIRRDGTITRHVADRQTAWHAGASTWRGFSGLNAYTLGWELANRNDGREPYTDAQYATLARLAAHYMRQGLALADFVGHQTVSPGRKTDPGPMFNWGRFREEARAELQRGREDSPAASSLVPRPAPATVRTRVGQALVGVVEADPDPALQRQQAPKPGAKTSEFWVTLAVVVLGGLASSGVIQSEDRDALVQVATAVAGMITAAAPAIAYIIGRAKLKAR
jgi:hypothetical protein